MNMWIKDNSKTSKQAMDSAIPHLAQQLANKTLDQLSKENIFVFSGMAENMGETKKTMVLKVENNDYLTGNVMGFIGCGQERLTITSRFTSDQNSDYFLQYMLAQVLEYPYVFNMKVDADPSRRVLDLLIYLFPSYLKSAMRKGLFKTYVRNRYNDSNPKGTINIARHIKENTPFVGKIAYDQREYSYDNALTQLIRHTIEHIRRLNHGHQILDSAKDEVRQVIASTESYRLQNRQKVLADNLKQPIGHAYFHEYRTLQQLCICILQHQKQSVGTSNTHIYGVLFDGAWLWEEYVNTLVCKWFYHPQNNAKQGTQMLFTTDGGKPRYPNYPDFLGKDSSCRLVGDAKYKHSNQIQREDRFQVLAYMLRFDAKTGYIFYPIDANNSASATTRLWLNQGTTYDNNVTPRNDWCVIQHRLVVPHSTDYDDFCEQMKKAEKQFIHLFSALPTP